MMIGTVGPGLPLELLEATGRNAGPLRWETGRPTPAADQWLENRFPQWAGSIIEDWAQGAFDHLESVLFSRADDAVQRLYYYLCELQRQGQLGGPEPLILDIAKIPRPSSEARTIASVRALAESWAVSDRALEDAIVAMNARRASMTAPTLEGPVCLLAGTPPLTRDLHEAIASGGFAAIGDTLAEHWADPGPPVEEGTGDPVAAIGRQLHTRPDDQRGYHNHAGWMRDRARAVGASAAVLWYTEEDETRVWELPPIRDALAADGLALLVLTRRDASIRDGAPEEIQEFLEGLNK